jgi:hypothetical protein
LKIADLQVRYFVRARYTLDRNTMEFVTEHDDVRKFEEKLVREFTRAVHCCTYYIYDVNAMP